MRGICTEHIQVHQHTVHFFLCHHAGTDYLFGQFIQYGGHTVLHIYRSYIRVGSYLEINGCERHTVIRTYRGHIGHARYAIDGTFQRSSYRLRHHIGTGSCITGRHRDRRRHNIRELRNRQRYQCQSSQTNDDDRDNSRKNRATNK